MKDNMVTVMAVLSLVAVFDVIVGGKLLFTVGEFAAKLSIAVVLCTITVATKSDWLAERLAGEFWFVPVILGTAVVIVVICDFLRLKRRLDRAATRRCHRYHRNNRGSRRTTPAKH